jgi:hypothetical protein
MSGHSKNLVKNLLNGTAETKHIPSLWSYLILFTGAMPVNGRLPVLQPERQTAGDLLQTVLFFFMRKYPEDQLKTDAELLF